MWPSCALSETYTRIRAHGWQAGSMEIGYDPFARGPLAVEVRSFEAYDKERDRLFPCEVWQPETEPGPLVVYSHHSLGHRRRATFLCEHLASHGYVVAAL